jgi:hypothetical protein
VKRITCSIYNGLNYKGCKAYFTSEEFRIKMLFFSILIVPSSNIIKFIRFSEGCHFKLEFNNGTKKNEIVDILALRKKKFIAYITEMEWPIEIRDKFEKETIYTSNAYKPCADERTFR